MNKNYFSDITDLFLKVKKEENIQIDESAKAQIKQMLQSKIREIKFKTTESQGPKQSFWNTWKTQLVGVPASLAALALVVYAATNLSVSIPKEDFSPPRNTDTAVNQETQEESSQVKSEFDRPLVKTAEGTLAIDFSKDEKETRALNKVPEKTTEVQIPSQPTTKGEQKNTFQVPKIEIDDSPTLILDEKEPEVTDNPKVEEEQKTVVEPVNKPEPEEIVTETQETQESQVPIIQPTRIEDPTAVGIKTDSLDLDADIPLDEAKTISTGGGAVTSTESIAPIKEDNQFPVYVYKDEALKSNPSFSKEKLAKLTRSKTPESVTVYYVTDNQVVVEIEESGITKWYLFDNVSGTWTISRYEKYVTDSVVK